MHYFYNLERYSKSVSKRGEGEVERMKERGKKEGRREGQRELTGTEEVLDRGSLHSIGGLAGLTNQRANMISRTNFL